MKLRPYQAKLVQDIRLQFQLGRTSTLAVLPTGGGKTVCFSHIADSAAKKGNRVCVLVHRVELLEQASRSMPMSHGLISANRSMDLSHAVQIASVQTLVRRLHKVPPDFFQLIIVDEAHHTTAGSWRKVIDHFSQAKLLGVTATPIRLDGRGLGENYESMVIGPSARWLTENGFLADSKVFAPPTFNAKGLKRRMGDYDMRQAEQQMQARQAMGDCVTHYRSHLSGQTAIAFCCTVAHAEAVAALFTANGVPAASIDGSMDSTTRRELLSSLGRGEIKVLTSCSLIGEGVDVPSVGGCILLRPTQSKSLHLQMIGRCLRPSPGKGKAVILDHVGNCLRLGHHLDDQDWTLEGVSKSSNEITSLKVCPNCFCTVVTATQVCPECGHVFTQKKKTRELVTVGGALQELKADEAQKAAESKKRKAEQSACRSLDQLVELGKRRGYKYPVAWARKVFAARGSKRN